MGIHKSRVMVSPIDLVCSDFSCIEEDRRTSSFDYFMNSELLNAVKFISECRQYRPVNIKNLIEILLNDETASLEMAFEFGNAIIYESDFKFVPVEGRNIAVKELAAPKVRFLQQIVLQKHIDRNSTYTSNQNAVDIFLENIVRTFTYAYNRIPVDRSFYYIAGIESDDLRETKPKLFDFIGTHPTISKYDEAFKEELSKVLC